MKETLAKLSGSNGTIKAVHSWSTGYQVLTFTSTTDYNKAKKAVEAK